jgi:hypothetical protein
MALGDSYATLAQLKTRLTNISDTNDDAALTNALATSSRAIEQFCGRQFNDAGAASARVYNLDTRHVVRVDDFHTTTGLVVETDDGDDGTFETTWSATDYQLEPLNQIVDGQTGWPYHTIRAVESRYFPCGRRTTVRVTARWGWSAVPTPVQEACLILSEETFRLKDAPFGVAGFGEFGVVRIRDNRKAAALLAPYRRHAVLVA